MGVSQAFERELVEDRRRLLALRAALRADGGDGRERLRAEIDAAEDAYQTRLTLIVVANELATAERRADLLRVLFETVINVIGCEEVAVLDTVEHEGERRFAVAHSMGVEPHWLRGINDPGSRLGRQLRAGHLRMPGVGPELATLDPRLSASVPIADDFGVFAAVLLYRLLPQKHGRLSERDLQVLRLIHQHPRG